MEYNLEARKRFIPTNSPDYKPKAQLTIWEAAEKLGENLSISTETPDKLSLTNPIQPSSPLSSLDTLIDESDPDTSVSQIQHLLQTAEAMRRDGKPDWMQLTGE